MGQKSETRIETERQILKLQLKEEMKNELGEIIAEKLEELIGPAVADWLGNILDFPLTVKQLAKMTGRTESNIYKMCQRAQIPFTKSGKHIHINLRDVNDQLLCLKQH